VTQMVDRGVRRACYWVVVGLLVGLLLGQCAAPDGDTGVADRPRVRPPVQHDRSCPIMPPLPRFARCAD
jgi:hypothetical protein